MWEAGINLIFFFFSPLWFLTTLHIYFQTISDQPEVLILMIGRLSKDPEF